MGFDPLERLTQEEVLRRWIMPHFGKTVTASQRTVSSGETRHGSAAPVVLMANGAKLKR